MKETRITVAHSPDSDDAFMFYGLASGNVDSGGIVVDQVLSDIETLNRAAFDGKYEVTAVSFHAYAHLVDKYALLPHGASMGDKYGPIVVAPAFAPQGSPGSYGAASVRGVTGVKGSRIAIPGTLTTAYLALRIYEPDFEYVVVPFDEIQQAVLAGKAEAGLLIHEGQLTYQDEGLAEECGTWSSGGRAGRAAAAAWRQHHPPGPRAADDREGVEDAHDSIAYALSHSPKRSSTRWQFGRGLDRAKTDRFVGMYVNDSHACLR